MTPCFCCKDTGLIPALGHKIPAAKKKKKEREREQRSQKYLSSAESIMGDGSMMMPLNKTRRKIR